MTSISTTPNNGLQLRTRWTRISQTASTCLLRGVDSFLLSTMMTADDDDDFIVPAVDDGVAADEPQGGAAVGGLLGWGGLKFVFSKKGGEDSSGGGAELEPSLPPGFSALLNAEEEEMYPAEDKIRVIVAEGNLTGRSRRRASDAHQSLQQVVSTAAIYCHLVRKHRGGGGSGRVGSALRHKPPTNGTAVGATITAGSNCGCGGASGACKAISILLQDELAKVAEAVEAERLGEIERKLRRAERRSGGLCNPAQLETLVRTSSLHGMVTPPAMVNPNSNSTSSSAHWGDGSPQYRRSSFATNRSDSGLSSMGNCLTEGRESVDAGNGSSLSGGVPDADTPWADDLLNAANRRRYAAMLRGRGRSLAKDLTLLMPTVVREVQGVVARLPPWDDESGEGDIAGLMQQLSVHGKRNSNGPNTAASNSNNRSRSGSMGSGTDSDASSFGHPLTQQNSSPAPVTSVVSPIKMNPGTPPLVNDRRSYSVDDSSQPTGNRTRTSTVLSPKPRPASMGRGVWSVFSSTGGTGSAGLGGALGGGMGSPFASWNGTTQSSAQSGRGEQPPTPPRQVDRAPRQDWKLSADELSLITSEEERVMPPEVLGKLLAAGASVQSKSSSGRNLSDDSDQRDFWDVFARLEVATRTEALLNIAIRGGKGCRARAGRMGRELSMSLTSVVLDAIATVQKQHKGQVGGYGRASVQRRRLPQEKRPHDLEKRGGPIAPQQRDHEFGTRRREALPRHSREHDAARSRPRPKSMTSATKAGVYRQLGIRDGVEDPGLADLDEREQEFRKAIFVVRSALSTRLLEMTRDAPLCAQILGSFVNDVSTKLTTTDRASAGGVRSAKKKTIGVVEGRENRGCLGPEDVNAGTTGRGIDTGKDRETEPERTVPTIWKADEDTNPRHGDGNRKNTYRSERERSDSSLPPALTGVTPLVDGTDDSNMLELSPLKGASLTVRSHDTRPMKSSPPKTISPRPEERQRRENSSGPLNGCDSTAPNSPPAT